MGSGKPDFRSGRPEGPNLVSERPELGYGRPNLSSDKIILVLKGLESGSERPIFV